MTFNKVMCAISALLVLVYGVIAVITNTISVRNAVILTLNMFNTLIWLLIIHEDRMRKLFEETNKTVKEEVENNKVDLQ